jgi:hypothetical protein
VREALRKGRPALFEGPIYQGVTGPTMRLVTTYFSIQSRCLTEGNLKIGAICDSIPTTVREVISTYREWHGTHESECRIELLDPAALAPKFKRSHQDAQVSLRIYMDAETQDQSDYDDQW